MKIFSTFSLFDSITLHASRFDLHHFRARFKTTVPAYLTLMKTMYARHTTGVIIIGTTATSILSFLYFYHTRQILSDYDAIARLNIARKIIDSMTPGVGQLGGIWLPFPQILMVPFIFNDFLWHSGLAGSFVSMAAYIASGFFLYKTALLITKNRYGSFLAWFVFVSNINIQLLQSMALSESFFLWNMIMVIYFLTRWSKKQDLLNLLITSFFLVVITLTRYEGYFVFIGAFVTVFTLSVLSHVKDRNRKKVEGTMILFGTIASYGIVLWCIYCLLFYKDPLYWLHLYSGPKGQIITTTQSNALGYKAVSKSFLESFTTYSEVVMLMNGILISTVAVAGFAMLVLVTVYGKFRKGIHTRLLPVIIIGTAVYFFLIYGYQKNFIPDIEFPRITSTSIFHKSLNFTSYSNIRYGIVMAPLIAVFIAFFASKKRSSQLSLHPLSFFNSLQTCIRHSFSYSSCRKCGGILFLKALFGFSIIITGALF